jgi:hypothetical protein
LSRAPVRQTGAAARLVRHPDVVWVFAEEVAVHQKYHLGEWVGSFVGLITGWTIALGLGDLGYGLWGHFAGVGIGFVAGMTIGLVIAALLMRLSAAE